MGGWLSVVYVANEVRQGECGRNLTELPAQTVARARELVVKAGELGSSISLQHGFRSGARCCPDGTEVLHGSARGPGGHRHGGEPGHRR